MNRKNVLVILCDQLRSDFLSCYGFKTIDTPNIDAIANDGVLFEHATTASPVCAPGRACMMTGRYVSDNGVWTNDVPFRDGIDFLPQRMTEADYYTFAIGKLHHFPGLDNKGFNVAYQMEENRLKDDDHYYQWLKEKHPEITSIFVNDEEGHFPFPEEEYYETWIANHALEEMGNRGDKPFFGWVSFQGPHTPIDVPRTEMSAKDLDVPDRVKPDFVPPCEVTQYRRAQHNFSEKEEQAYREGYCHLIEEIDMHVGRLVAYLKENGLYDNTVIMFSADHGDLCGDYSMRQKGPFIYKAQFEIPFLIANHPDLGKGERSDMLVSNIDIAATALEVAGDTKPLGYSRSIAKMMNNEELQRNVIYSEFADSIRIVSTKTHRMGYYPFTGECELVAIDDETTNLANLPEYAALKCELLQHIIDFMVIAKGVRIEAQDLTPKVQAGLDEKLPGFRDEIPLCFPISNMGSINCIKEAGLDHEYLEFCKEKNIIRCYGKYWEERKPNKQTIGKNN